MDDHRDTCNRLHSYAVKHAGFTVIELLAATLIALPMLLLVVKIVPVASEAFVQSEGITQTSFLAHQKAESLRAQLLKPSGSGFATSYTQAATLFPSPYNLCCFTVVDSGGASFKTLTVTVWEDRIHNLVFDASEQGTTIYATACKRY